MLLCLFVNYLYNLSHVNVNEVNVVDLFNKNEEICKIFMIFRNILQKYSWFMKYSDYLTLLQWIAQVQFTKTHQFLAENGERSLNKVLCMHLFKWIIIISIGREKLLYFWWITFKVGPSILYLCIKLSDIVLHKK